MTEERDNVLTAGKYLTDKSQDYLDNYDRFLRPLQAREVKLLELGVNQGGSLLMWRDYFPKGVVAGLDFRPLQLADETGRVRLYQGRQEDLGLLTRIAGEVAPEGFDVIIDDCSHIAEHARASFWHLFEDYLKPGGLYSIEDWGTGYWARWPDGRAFDGTNHFAGMVGFIKELVDECGMADITKPGLGQAPHRESKFERMMICFGQCFVVKARSAAPPV
jgi:SAM-dependent methyltransferase